MGCLQHPLEQDRRQAGDVLLEAGGRRTGDLLAELDRVLGLRHGQRLFKAAGVELKYGDGFSGSTFRGINKSGWAGYTPADLADASKYTNFLTTSHNRAQDTYYEMKIPLSALGLTRAKVENEGLGVMLISTFGQSGINSLPHDPTVLDKALSPYSADASTSAEKEDVDVFSVPLARIGKYREHTTSTTSTTVLGRGTAGSPSRWPGSVVPVNRRLGAGSGERRPCRSASGDGIG